MVRGDFYHHRQTPESTFHLNGLGTLLFEDMQVDPHGSDLFFVPTTVLVPGVVVNRLLHTYGMVSL